MADYNSKFTGPEIDSAIGAVAGKVNKKVPSEANNVALLDAEGNLADSGKALTPAGIGALASDGTAAAAKKLATARTFPAVNLAGTAGASFDGSQNPSALGVTGILPVSHGGTGNSSVDTTPTSGSTKMVTSGGVYTMMSTKLSKSYADDTYLPLTGGRVSGTLKVGKTDTGAVTISEIGIGKADGSALSVGNVYVHGNKIYNLEEPTGDSYAANKEYVDSHIGSWYGTCPTSASTAAKMVTLTDSTGFTLTAGARVAVKFTYSNSTTAATLNVNKTGAKNIRRYGTTAVTTNTWMDGSVVDFVYDGTSWIMIGLNGIVPVSQGGTGITTLPQMIVNLESTVGQSPLLASSFPGVRGILPIAHGGTGNNSGYVRAGQADGFAVGTNATAEGLYTIASGAEAHAEGYCTEATGVYSHAGGSYSKAQADSAFAHGLWAKADTAYSMVTGMANKSVGKSKEYFVVGGGSSDTARSNLFRVSSDGIYGAGAYNSTGADYAEYFEWEDGNPDGEDRTALFVALRGEKIRLAGPEDEPIGIISANPSVIGDSYGDQWRGMYLTDIYGRLIMEEVTIPAITDSEGNVISPENRIMAAKLNPDYDNAEQYIPRSERPEWGGVGLMGKLVLIDDGTCEVDGYCKPSEGGIATRSDEKTRFRVMARLDELHIKVLEI